VAFSEVTEPDGKTAEILSQGILYDKLRFERSVAATAVGKHVKTAVPCHPGCWQSRI
jgi:hypothetical protein